MDTAVAHMNFSTYKQINARVFSTHVLLGLRLLVIKVFFVFFKCALRIFLLIKGTH